MQRFCVSMLVSLLLGCGQSGPVKKQDVSTPGQTDTQYRATVHAELAAGYFSRGQYGVALEELNEALRADPNYAFAYNMLGLVYMELREDQQAEQNFQYALKLKPADSETHNNYGWFLCQRNRGGESIKHFLEAVKNPLYATPEKAFVNAGLCSLKAGDQLGAEDFFLKAVRIQPQEPQALLNLAKLSFKNARYAEAKRFLDRYVQVASATAESLWLGVIVERKLGDRKAQGNLEMQLRKSFPGSDEVRRLVAGQFDNVDAEPVREGKK
jgi:type IV pilus assembly protein PilF